MSNCISRLLMMYGFLSLWYSTALLRGKSLLWKAIRQSQAGHSDTGFWNEKGIEI